MKCKLLIALVIALCASSGVANAVSENDFQVQTTRELLNLCTASKDDALYDSAIGFCHGYLVGAYKFYEAEHAGPSAPKLVCLPLAPPSRADSISMFIEWAIAHPQYWNEAPVETEFRFLTEKWPCKP